MNEDDFKPIILNPKKESTINIVAPKVPHQTGASNTVKKVVNDDGHTDILPVMVDKKFGQLMQQKRAEMKLTQKQLAQALALPVNVINEYEKGTAVRNGQYISKIKNYLKIDKNTV
jgi:ribosome-binding protein aMBF1 (putative translation factor)